MNKSAMNLLRVVSLLVLVAALSGCRAGERRLRATDAPAQPVQQQNQPGTAPATEPDKVEAAAPTATTQPPEMTSPSDGSNETSPSTTSDEVGQNLLKQINNLDAANQAGDPMEDLP